MTSTSAPATSRTANLSRLGRISSHVDQAELLDAMRAALPTVTEDAALLFAALDDENLAAIVARFDRPGCYVRRTEATTYSPATADVRVILPSGDLAEVRVSGYKRAPKVNWSGCGDMTPADAVAYAGAIALAASIADTLTAEVQA